ncbi:MAG: hypothetical protein JNL06_15270 [Alphaproteobacteria bacterium]|nr:hypothetical protein [Alphaproteobacteria bacterium]
MGIDALLHFACGVHEAQSRVQGKSARKTAIGGWVAPAWEPWKPLRVYYPSDPWENTMTIDRASVRDIEPFFISTYLRSGDSGRVADPGSLPTPLLDPHSLETAQLAYDSALGELRTRHKAGLRPSTRHVLANRILSFAIFGERDPRLLAERALAHFP